MNKNDKIYIKLEETEITPEEQEVIKYTESFLNSEYCKNMNHCFESIRNSKNERIIKESIKTMGDEEFDLLFPLVTNVLLTANKVECDSLNYLVSKKKGSKLRRREHLLPIIPNNNVGVAEAYLFRYDSFYMLHINAFDTGSNTPGGSTDIVRFISRNNLLNPSLIISVGVCYGRKPFEQNIGDVIIPQKLYPWSIGQKFNNKEFTIKHDDFQLWLFQLFSGSKIYSNILSFCDGNDGKTINGKVKLKNGDKEEIFKFNVKTRMGNMSTGEAVISSEYVKRIIREANNNDNELGGEMEGYGMAKECIYYSHIPCFIVKSICDWGVLKNITPILNGENCVIPEYLKDRLQAYASFCAGIVLFKLIDSDKEEFVKLKIYDDVSGCVKGDNFLSGIKYYDKKKIIDWLARYYNTDNNIAEKIFGMLINNKYIVSTTCVPNKYKYNKEGYR